MWTLRYYGRHIFQLYALHYDNSLVVLNAPISEAIRNQEFNLEVYKQLEDDIIGLHPEIRRGELGLLIARLLREGVYSLFHMENIAEGWENIVWETESDTLIWMAENNPEDWGNKIKLPEIKLPKHWRK